MKKIKVHTYFRKNHGFRLVELPVSKFNLDIEFFCIALQLVLTLVNHLVAYAFEKVEQIW